MGPNLGADSLDRGPSFADGRAKFLVTTSFQDSAAYTLSQRRPFICAVPAVYRAFMPSHNFVHVRMKISA